MKGWKRLKHCGNTRLRVYNLHALREVRNFRTLTMASLFDGIGGWQLAAVRNGVKPIWSSEIEKFPMECTKKHFPDTIQLGDIRNIENPPHVDIVCAGSPCQDLSVAGSREGLKGERSGLFHRAIELVRQIKPRYFIWENVTGSFSSNQGRDFRAVLEEITEAQIPMPGSGRWARAGMVRAGRTEVAWRVLDAQFWGVPQHRERIFLIASFDGGGGTQVLFEPESLLGLSAEGRETAPSTGTTGGVQTAGRAVFVGNGQKNQKIGRVAGSMNTMHDQPTVVIYENHPNDRRVTGPNETSQTLSSRMGTGGGNTPLTVTKGYARRITPLEAERLQGLPDNWTKGGSESARYKAIGNGMAQPCADFVMACVVEMERRKRNDDKPAD